MNSVFVWIVLFLMFIGLLYIIFYNRVKAFPVLVEKFRIGELIYVKWFYDGEYMYTEEDIEDVSSNRWITEWEFERVKKGIS